MLLAFLYLLFICLMLGFSVWKLLKIEDDDPTASLFLYFATGLVVFIQTSIILGFLNLANWLVYFILALLLFVIAYLKGDIKFIIPSLNKSWVLILFFFLGHFFVYFLGAFSYPWLEDDDPWLHASGVRYVSVFSTYVQPSHLLIHYLAPYPPFFDILLGVLFQLGGISLPDLLKFFNVFLISLSIPLFYCWIRKRFDSNTAIWATFILTILPSFMSHFIWAQSLSILLVFPSLYFLDRAADIEDPNKRNIFGLLAIIFSASAFLVQPSAAIMFAGLLVLSHIVAPFLINMGKLSETIKFSTAIIFVAFLLSFLEFWLPMSFLYGADRVLGHIGFSNSLITGRSEDTSGGLVYGFSDFFFVPFASKIDQATGIGVFASLPLLLGLIACSKQIFDSRKNHTPIILLLWFIYGLVGVEGNLLPIKLFPHRFWVFFAISVALIAGFGMNFLLSYLEERRKGLVLIAKVVFIAGLLWTSAYPKYVVQTAVWPPGAAWASQEQLIGYMKLKSLSLNTKVFGYCMQEDFVNGVGMAGYAWDKNVSEYKITSINDSMDGNYAFLKNYGYQYAIIDHSCLRVFEQRDVESKLTILAKDGRFKLQKNLSSNGFLVFAVK